MQTTFIIASFIGIAINIWRDTAGTGGGAPSTAIRQRNDELIQQRDGELILLRA